MDELNRTVLFEKHQQLNAKSIGFCGWEMPVQYEGIIKEHDACRNAAALFDISHMGEFFYEGDIENSGVNVAATTDFAKLPVGKCKYGFLLNEKGGVIDDLIVYKLSENRLMFVVNAARIDVDFKQIQSHIKSGTFEDRSNVTSKIDIQGPKSKEILQLITPFDLDELKYFGFKETTLLDSSAIVSRTGYTGELGYELYIDNKTAPLLWDKLVSLGATPAGLGARDVLRLEKGYSLYGNELDESITPLEASLESFVKFDKNFTGRAALEEQKANGIPRKIIAFTTKSKRAPRHGFEIFQRGEKIGVVTSGTFSPSVGEGIGLGLVDSALYREEDDLELKNERGMVKIYKATLPFYK
ncbi:MAG: glycine cleavage system aminomethyltransferase GcvT [Sulfurospirillaceae bacterium]|nr:glycine cleavage system aminomethyltransferase GcvT [Sulfurospirillaceae bacterium]